MFFINAGIQPGNLVWDNGMERFVKEAVTEDKYFMERYSSIITVDFHKYRRAWWKNKKS